MLNLILMGEGGSINPDRVVLVASMASSPVKRFVRESDPDKVVNLTYGYPQRSVVVFDNGTLAITHYLVEELSFALRAGKEVEADELPF